MPFTLHIQFPDAVERVEFPDDSDRPVIDRLLATFQAGPPQHRVLEATTSVGVVAVLWTDVRDMWIEETPSRRSVPGFLQSLGVAWRDRRFS